jgi:hypothetical protein
MYDRSYRATGRYNRSYTDFPTGMTGLIADHTGHSQECRLQAEILAGLTGLQAGMIGHTQYFLCLTENLAGLTGLMAGITGHTLNCQQRLTFFFIRQGLISWRD